MLCNSKSLFGLIIVLLIVFLSIYLYDCNNCKTYFCKVKTAPTSSPPSTLKQGMQHKH